MLHIIHFIEYFFLLNYFFSLFYLSFPNKTKQGCFSPDGTQQSLHAEVLWRVSVSSFVCEETNSVLQFQYFGFYQGPKSAGEPWLHLDFITPNP